MLNYISEGICELLTVQNSRITWMYNNKSSFFNPLFQMKQILQLTLFSLNKLFWFLIIDINVFDHNSVQIQDSLLHIFKKI